MRKQAAARAVAVKAAPRKPLRSARARAGDAAGYAAGPGIYAVHPGVFALQRWIRDLTASTGRSLVEWVAHIREAGPADERACRVWLQETYAIGGSCGLWLTANAYGNREALAESTPEGYLSLAPQYVERMFAGGKARLLSVYEELVAAVQKLGDDVQICPCKTAVSLYRRRLFARVTPHTPRRMELGLSLGEEPHTTRLCRHDATSGGDRITHHVALASSDDLDLQVRRWLKQAYDRGV